MLMRCTGRASGGFSCLFMDEKEDLTILSDVEKYLRTRIPCLEWDDLDQLELIMNHVFWKTLRKPPLLLEDGRLKIVKAQKQMFIADGIIRGRDIEELERLPTDSNLSSQFGMEYQGQGIEYPASSDNPAKYPHGNRSIHESNVAESPEKASHTAIYSTTSQQTDKSRPSQRARPPKYRGKQAQKQKEQSPNDKLIVDTRGMCHSIYF